MKTGNQTYWMNKCVELQKSYLRMLKKVGVAGVLTLGGIFFLEVNHNRREAELVRIIDQAYQGNVNRSVDPHETDVDNDGRKDIVLKLHSGQDLVLYNSPIGYTFKREGEYLTSEQLKQREIERIETGYLEQLRDVNEFYRKAYADVNNSGGRE